MCAFRTAADLKHLPATRDFVFSQAREAGLPNELERKLDLVLEEILVNVMNYAYGDGEGEVEVECDVRSDSFCCTVRDWGPTFNPLHAPTPDTSLGIDERPVGGLGLMFVNTMSDTCSYVRENEANELTFCFSL